MNRKIVRVLGKRGRITIPYEIRVRNKIGYNDILSFEERIKHHYSPQRKIVRRVYSRVLRRRKLNSH